MKEATKKLLEKADRSLQTAKSLLESRDMEFVASRAYYAMFYAAEALLNEKGMSFRKHSGVHSTFGKTFVKSGEFNQKYHQWLMEAFNERLVSDYAFETQVTPESAKELVSHAEEFLQEAKNYLSK
ncbi:MAG: HEPN domain-containing protein [Candidatus Omnitrophica bacterium]|nr:HEPN domain-containing protein [Candidatus Omnitrophota bacterium]